MLDYRKKNLEGASKLYFSNSTCFLCMTVCSIVSQTFLTAETFWIQHVLTEHSSKTESEEWNFCKVYRKDREIRIKSLSVTYLELLI
jgi:hypothetical protein